MQKKEIRVDGHKETRRALGLYVIRLASAIAERDAHFLFRDSALTLSVSRITHDKLSRAHTTPLTQSHTAQSFVALGKPRMPKNSVRALFPPCKLPGSRDELFVRDDTIIVGVERGESLTNRLVV